jgi:adenine-specific DNA-methyltransferase
LFEDLDEELDGWLIKSENWQALNLLLNKYYEKVQTIYIDPPFNKENEADYLYKVGYKDATWATMLENRLRLARDLLKNTGSIFVRCDYNGNWIVRCLMDEIFGKENFKNEIIISRTRAKQLVENQFVQQTESLFFYSRGEKLVLKEIERPQNPEWHPLLHFPRADETPRIIMGKEFYPPKGRRWALSQERINKFEREGKIRINNELSYVDCRGKIIKGVPELLYDTEVVGNEWIDIPGYSQAQHFPTENSEILLKRVIESTSNEGDLVLDFFLGSGTTTAVAHKLGRKWIGVEMGEHFYSVVLPRMKKVLAYDESGISKEEDVKEKYNGKTAGGFFKYHTLEQYEDALENIEFEKQDKSLYELPDYFVKYMLKWETKNSNTFLNLENFKNPFNYKLKIIENYQQKEVKADVIETFNYLLGLSVIRYKVLEDNGRKYVFVFGNKDEKNVAIVWRSMEGIDLEKDKEIIENNIKDFKPDDIYINGDAIVKRFKAIEPLLKTLMFDRLGVK